MVLDVSNSEGYTQLSDYITQDRKSGYDMLRVANLTNSNFFRNQSWDELETPLPELMLDEEDADSVGMDEVDGGKQPRKLVRELRKTYDIILVDAGYLGNPNGTFWLTKSDINVLVLDCTRTTRESLEHQHREFENSGISIDGSVLNKRQFPIPSSLYWLVG